ncbi:TPA: extracellular solute-binding protein [Legionella pneumophila]|uniref:extracellular solute-binding protein n=1 Tax=Legionella pneumophila TaxID=446 RepID=UPI00026D9BA9|nr:extracellular solute-binding protein [Legionella pneumophila]ANH13621.1 glycerol-3-phosphate ABC transporter substrate-binding protein [Legionella pneumophila]ANH16585.1 glycerol-3-phosphate ABC transporter substrate-binding protein [Legionella pneumophila]ANH19560.1 glycerol-3-phosphate ABC transporter substrate-binding protein [Legionella pneumophila]APX20437.1 glycerol-3-phosphate ABC transporter substrate-binding protein [Legionella pneumophila]AQL12616.1 glycerol-3-phosphate ABC transp
MKILFLLLLIFLSVIPAQAKPVELVFWHAMAGHLGDEVRLLADDFNKSQNQYRVKPIYKGNYTETLTNFAAAFRARQAPSIVQIFEVGTSIMLAPPGVIKPVDLLMSEQGISLPKDDFIQSVREFYSRDGQLMAMPFNLSAPVLYYNADILAKVGYGKHNFPQTWSAMEIMAEKIKKAGYDCTYTSAYPGWVLFESFLAIHGLPITQGNPARAAFHTPQLMAHFQRLKRWHDLHYFRYGGRVDDATILFTSSVCPLFSQSSGAYNSLSALVPFHLGVATMPLDTGASPIRHANVAGGAALWAVGGQTEEQYRGIARFFAFIAKPEVQKRWHEHTGYLPLGLKGIYANIVQSSQHPALLLARTDLEDNLSEKPYKHMGPQNQIRGINDEVLEAMFADLMSPEEALNEATIRANHLLLRFARNTQRERVVDDKVGKGLG